MRRRLPVSGAQAAALLALCLVLRVVSLVRPCLSDDEATYAVVGREMLAGQVLYRDVVDHKPPGIYVVNELSQAIGGPDGGMVLLHLALIVVVWATGLCLAAIVRRRSGGDSRAGPVFAALLWTVFTTTLIDTDSLAANCELFMMLPLVASFAVILRALGDADRRMRSMVWAGALVGLAMLFKYQAAVQLPIYAFAWLVVEHRRPARVAAGILALAVGVALPVLGTAAWLVATHALPAAWFWFQFNFGYISAGSTSDLFWRMVVRGGFVLVAAAPLYALAYAALGQRPRPVRCVAYWSVLGWLVVSAAAVTVGGRFFGHYFHQLTAPVVVLAAPIAAELWERRGRALACGLAIPALAFLVLGALHDRFMTAVGEPDPDYASVVAWLDDHADRSETMCVWGNSPMLYFEADRPLGCRFVFSNYLTGMSPATASQTDPAVDASANIVPEAWDMLGADLDQRRPTFIVDDSPGNVDFYGKWPPSRFPRLAETLARDYTAEADVAGMRIYRRRTRSP